MRRRGEQRITKLSVIHVCHKRLGWESCNTVREWRPRITGLMDLTVKWTWVLAVIQSHLPFRFLKHFSTFFHRLSRWLQLNCVPCPATKQFYSASFGGTQLIYLIKTKPSLILSMWKGRLRVNFFFVILKYTFCALYITFAVPYWVWPHKI